MNNKELARWVERAREGDAQAFAHLYSRFSRPVYFAALRMTGNEFDAKDVLQDVMIRLYQSMDGIRNPQALGSFLNTTTYRTCLRRLERERKIPVDEDDSRLEQVAETSADFIPEDYADRQETRELVGRLVDELSPALKSVVLLYYFEQMPVRAIAKTLEINKQTVKSRLEYARAVLRRKLDAQQAQETRREKEGVLRAMSVPVLTKILQQQAQHCLPPETSAQVWEQIGAQLGLPTAAVAATAAIAAAPGAATIAAGTAAGAKAVTGAIALVSLAAAATTGAVIVANRPQPPTPVPAPPVPYAAEAVPPAAPADPIVIDFSPPAEEDIASSPAPPAPYTEPGEDRPHPSDDGPQATPSRPAAGAEAPAVSDPLPASPADSGGGSGGGAGSGGASEAGIALRTATLHYPANTALTEEDVLRDSGAAFRAPLEIVGLELVDTSLPGESAVYVQPQSAGGETAYRKVLIIVID